MSTPTQSTRTVVIEGFFPHPPEKLWRALTESRLLARWLMNNDFEPEAGCSFQFRADPVPGWDGLVVCEVLTIEPMKQLSYTWSSMGQDSVVLWTLTPGKGGTHLRMEHSGFGPSQTASYRGAQYGWTKFIGNLERVLEGLQ